MCPATSLPIQKRQELEEEEKEDDGEDKNEEERVIIVSEMVFGNMNANSGFGTVYSRDPDTGENVLTGKIVSHFGSLAPNVIFTTM